MEELELQTGAPTVHFEENIICISVVEETRVTPRVKHIETYVCFILEQFYNSLFVQKYDKYSAMPSDMCTKPCSGLIISQGNKGMTGFILYPTSDTKDYQLMRLYEIVVKYTNYGICISVLFALYLLRITYYVISCNPK